MKFFFTWYFQQQLFFSRVPHCRVLRRWNWHKMKSSCTCEPRKTTLSDRQHRRRRARYAHEIIIILLFVQSSSQLKNLYCKYGLMYIFKRSCRRAPTFETFFMTFNVFSFQCWRWRQDLNGKEGMVKEDGDVLITSSYFLRASSQPEIH